MVATYEWDDAKLERNWREHGVSFGEAIALLEHGQYIEAPDEREDYGEDRWVAAGQSPIRPGNLLLVAFTERGKIIRIIHAREYSTREVECIFGDDA